MKTVPLAEAKAKLSRLINEIDNRDEEVTITRNGKVAAVMISPDQFDSWKVPARYPAGTLAAVQWVNPASGPQRPRVFRWEIPSAPNPVAGCGEGTGL